MDALRFEGDQGLWELVWALNADHPEAPVAAKVALAREVTLRLVREGAVELRTAPWPLSPSGGRQLSASEMQRLATEDPPWIGDPEAVGDLTVWVMEK